MKSNKFFATVQYKEYSVCDSKTKMLVEIVNVQRGTNYNAAQMIVEHI